MGIDDLIVLAQKKGVTTIAITDRDCQAGTVRGKIIGERRGITVIPGVEISSYDSKREKYVEILGYLCDSPDRLEGLCHRNIVQRKKASQLMTLKVARKYPITPELVLKCATGSTAVFEQHIMHALLECGITDRIYGEIYHELFSPESEENVLVKVNYPEPAEVIDAIHDAGGIAVLAYAGNFKDTPVLDKLIKAGIDGIEIWCPQHDEESVAELTAFAKKNHLLAIGGSDFRGRNNRHCVSLGSYSTPENNFNELNNYKAKLRRQQKKLANEEK
jgi:predicted metal-dependent phosphoesterase TrpH